jgi:ParB/RepB/Spo0J family partition protein
MNLSELPLDEIEEGDRARDDYGTLDDLTESIKDKGIIQPITVAQCGAGHYRLLAGGRRLRAATLVGLPTIPCIIRESGGEVDDREIELLENVVRKDFTWQERCHLEEQIYKLREVADPNWSQRKTATLIGRPQSALSQDMELCQAMRAVPELAEADSQNEAWKKWQRIKEDLAVQHIIQERRATDSALPKDAPVPLTSSKKFDSLSHYVDSKYHIGDAIAEMQKLSPGIIDFAEVDPPYAVNLKAHRKKAKDQHIVHDYNELPEETYADWLEKLFFALFRVMKPNSFGILWYGSKWYPEVTRTLIKAGFAYTATPAIWVKTGGGYSPNPKTNLANLYENFIVFRKGSPTLCKEGRANVFQFAQPSAANRIHPTERPVELMEELLRVFTNEACITLIPFLGSGATLRAAYNLDRVAFGYDLNSVYRDRLLAKES